MYRQLLGYEPRLMPKSKHNPRGGMQIDYLKGWNKGWRKQWRPRIGCVWRMNTICPNRYKHLDAEIGSRFGTSWR